MTEKRILALNYEFPPLGGGASPVSYEIAKRLSETDATEIDVVTMGFRGLPRFEQVNSNLAVYRVACLRSKREICFPWEQATYLITGFIKAAQLIKQRRYDVCHCHFIIPTGVIAFCLKKIFGLPYVLTTHGSDVIGYNHRFKFIYPLLEGFWKRIVNNARMTISPSSFLKREIMKVHPSLDESSLVVIPNGFEVDKFEPKAKKNVIFSSGRLLVNKGFQHLIGAVSAKDIGYEIHIAGDGPMMADLRLLAKASRTPVFLHGWMDNRGGEYAELLEGAAIYVLASEKENASVALLEAMSAGCAVITTLGSGCAETVGDAGVLIAPNDSEAILDALLKLIDDPIALKFRQDSSRARIQEYFSWDKIIKRYNESL